MMRRCANIPVLGVCTALLAACASAPPDPALPMLGLQEDARFAALPADAVVPTLADRRWWRRFDDPAVGHWVELALAGHPDIEIGQQRLALAQALMRSAQGLREPLVSASARLETGTQRGANARQLQPSAALTLVWDTDLWGGLRQAENSAAARVMQAHHLAQAARLATAGLAARAVVEWREAQLDAALLARALALQADVQRITQMRVDAGLVPRLDLERAQAETAGLQAQAASATLREQLALSALQTLAGQAPGVASAAQTSHAAAPSPPRSPAPSTVASAPAGPAAAPLAEDASAAPPRLLGPLPAAVPADLIRNRPDLRAAEQALRAAAADVGIAQAELSPRLRLPATLSLISGTAVLDTVTANLAALLDTTLFDGGRRRAGVDAANSRMREAAAVYRQSLLQALQQADAAYLASAATARQIEALQHAVGAADAAVDQARMRNAAGLSGSLDVLDALRTALSQRRALLRAQADAARQAVAGFEALGLIDDEPTDAAR